MPRYVSLVKYSPEALKGVRSDGYATRPAAMKALAASVGVTLESVDFIMPGSEWDLMAVSSAPSSDNVVAMGSFASASGVVERSVTFELMSGEAIDAAIAASTPDYTPPGGS